MAQSPKPGASRGVVKPPNEAGPHGNRASNSSSPLARTVSPIHTCEHGGGNRRRGCVPLDGVASPVHPPAHHFDIDAAKMPQPPSAIEPGRGAIPVDPWDTSGRPNRAASDFEVPKEPRR
jgi:hypothetical protein